MKLWSVDQADGMEHMEFRLLPKRPISWFIWIGLLVICLPRYYSSFPFPQLIYQYEAEMWTRPREVTHDANKWSVTVRAPKAITDFTDVPMSVLVRNNQTSPASAQVSATLKCRDGDNVCKENIAYTRALVRDSVQSSVSLEHIPANGEVITWFDLRVVLKSDGQATPNPEITLETNVGINQKDVFSPKEAFLSRFDRDQVFRLWAIEYLLSPPGSNIVVPIFFLCIVVLAEIVSDMVVMLRRSDDRDELAIMYDPRRLVCKKRVLICLRWIFVVLLGAVVVLLLLAMWMSKPLVDLGPVFREDPLNLRLRHTMFWFVIGAIVLGIVLGFLASTRKQNQPRA